MIDIEPLLIPLKEDGNNYIVGIDPFYNDNYRDGHIGVCVMYKDTVVKSNEIFFRDKDKQDFYKSIYELSRYYDTCRIVTEDDEVEGKPYFKKRDLKWNKLHEQLKTTNMQPETLKLIADKITLEKEKLDDFKSKKEHYIRELIQVQQNIDRTINSIYLLSCDLDSASLRNDMLKRDSMGASESQTRKEETGNSQTTNGLARPMSEDYEKNISDAFKFKAAK